MDAFGRAIIHAVYSHIVDHRKVQRQLPHEANQRPAKRTHISPLHQDAVGSSNITQPKPIKPVSAGGFSFGNASVGVTSKTTQVLQSTSGLTSFQSSDGFGSVFSSTSGKFECVPSFICIAVTGRVFCNLADCFQSPIEKK